jgi:diaminohydroxyphosphoribosylaminopyrimidine deaminase/5-amino-6-(5-phosphoribosylamino)uracil reductase
MEETIFHKFTQHSDLRAELLATGDAELVEVHYPSYFFLTIC